MTPEWPRQKMLALLIGAAVISLVLVAGAVLAVVYAVRPTGHPVTKKAASAPNGIGSGTAPAEAPDSAADPRDVLAAKPMATVDPEASHPGPVSSQISGATITLPAPAAAGPAQVPTGFPHTPAGALAQLAAIDQIAIQSGSLAGARAVITSWALPDGPNARTWSVIRGLIALFDEAGLSGGGSDQLALVLTPLMGQIKGSVGPDFVIPCIDFELDVTLAQTARGATADCQRMVWQPNPGVPGGAGGRWVIGSGSEPATPPSVWPDTDLAIAVGYRDLRTEAHA